ncbi:tannase/feruloyl esterase family alpha/beta hydrolase [Pelagibacterium nitratireducens]|uniref:Tannase/feruloyl esterase family alpha/beta hydrolase n=1 Tax=Pelagibacterium nitratireducens TaxID=1046114 RepID=A0ABZ2I523_9HYPH
MTNNRANGPGRMGRATLVAGLIAGLGTMPGWAVEIAADSAAGWCESLSGFAYPDLRIDSTELRLDEMSGETSLPPHCVLTGYMEERKGVDDVAFSTGFELRLPLDWNERFYFQGGGGTDGSIRPAVGTNTAGQPPALTMGYAVVSTDAGHTGSDGRDASFGLDPKARIDWGYNSLDLVTGVSKSLLQSAYDMAPRYSYLVGASNGGRQGLTAAQRFANHFDGIIAGAPIISQSRGHVATAWDLAAMAEIAPRDAEGRPLLSEAYSQADTDLIFAEMIAQCDGHDGLEDGIIDLPLRCQYDPSPIVCEGEKTDSCITAVQAEAFVKVHEGARNAAGEQLYAPFPYDPGSDFRRWKLGTATEWPNNNPRATNTSIRYVFMTPPDPDFDSFAFDFETDPATLEGSAEFSSANSPNMDAFRFAGGKVIVYHGTGDQGVSAIDTVDWYDAMIERYGSAEAVQDFARLYLMPGVGHVSGGTGPELFDGLDALVAWVEDGVAPGHLPVSGGTPDRERLLCVYPAETRYDAASAAFICE